MRSEKSALDLDFDRTGGFSCRRYLGVGFLMGSLEITATRQKQIKLRVACGVAELSVEQAIAIAQWLIAVAKEVEGK